MSKRAHQGNYFGWQLSYENDGTMGLYIQENNSSGLSASVTTNQIYNELFHFVAVFDAGTSVRLYVNGNNVAESPTNLSYLSNNDAPFLISSLQFAGDWSWDGKLDNLFIFNDALSDDEVDSIFTNDIDITDNNLQGYWNFNAGSSEILYDHSGNGNHGTINGATWVENVYVYGCTDELACNHNPEANWDDDSCDYTCPDNGDYSLSFDGVDDYVGVSKDFGSTVSISAWAKRVSGNNIMLWCFGNQSSGPDLFFSHNKICLNTWDSDANLFGNCV
jgi:hypothetical protein